MSEPLPQPSILALIRFGERVGGRLRERVIVRFREQVTGQLLIVIIPSPGYFLIKLLAFAVPDYPTSFPWMSRVSFITHSKLQFKN